MKPIYFPFTYVPEPVAQALAACCGPFIVYQPLGGRLPETMQPWVERGFIDIRIPVAGDEQLLEKAVNDYRNWAHLQLEASGGAKNAFLKAGADRRPLFDSSASSQIVAEVKARQREKTAPAGRPAVLSARMFLYFAQQFDSQNRGVDGVLQDFAQKEERLMRELQPEEGGLPGGRLPEHSPPPDDFTDYMLETRMEAWTRLLLSDSQSSPFFVTHRRSVLEHVLEYAPEAEEVLHVSGTGPIAENVAADALKAQKRMADLTRIAADRTVSVRRGEVPAFWQDIPAGITLSIYRMAGRVPGELFARCAGIKERRADGAHGENEGWNTLIGLIEPSSAQ